LVHADKAVRPTQTAKRRKAFAVRARRPRVMR
jgi:hypothetical protein